MDLAEQAKAFYWYHRVELTPGIVTDGVFDHRPLLGHYGFADDMRGWNVLDVGRASGFFSFEFERRGARVTATELASFYDWDFVGGAATRDRIRGDLGAEEFDRYYLGAFPFAHAVKKSTVVARAINVYDIRPEAFLQEKFDLVFAGSLMSHLRDPVLALERLRSVTSGQCVLAAPVHRRPRTWWRRRFPRPEEPLMFFQGATDRPGMSWWVMNVPCLLAMMKSVRFRDVKVVSQFDLVNRSEHQIVPHVVVHARGD